MYAMQEVSPDQCQEFIFCGMPLYYPASTMLPYNHWIPAPRPRIYRNTSLELLTTEDSGRNRKRLLFRASGPDHMAIFLSPMENIELVSWSFDDGKVQRGPKWKDGRYTYFIFYSHGLSPKPWEFWVELEVPKTFYTEDDMLDMVAAGHFIHGHEMKTTPEFKRFLSQYPKWSYVVGWTASLRNYRF